MFAESGWHTPPPNEPQPEPPRDYVDDEPYRPLHPIRRGLAAAWFIIGAALLATPAIVVAGAIYLWWRILLWLTDTD